MLMLLWIAIMINALSIVGLVVTQRRSTSMLQNQIDYLQRAQKYRQALQDNPVVIRRTQLQRDARKMADRPLERE